MFVLISKTPGDSLFSPREDVVLTSTFRSTLEREKRLREEEREAWLKNNNLPWWIQGSIITEEYIKEVPFK